MSDPVRLPLKTLDGRPLLHKYYPQRDSPRGLLVIFPGAHYGPDGPLLYYPREALRQAGWDSLDISYGFSMRMQELSAALIPQVLAECRTALEVVLSQREVPRVSLFGKSMGAGVVAHLCQTEKRLASARAAYLTPPLGTPFFDPIFSETRQPAFVAIGTADRFYQAQALAALKQARTFDLALIEGADHHLGFPGELSASFAAMQSAVLETIEFLTG